MKKAIIFSFMLLLALGLFSCNGKKSNYAGNEIKETKEATEGTTSQEVPEKVLGYVDLGLPSGTLWKRQNESGFYTYEQAINRFGNKLPERHHFVELKNECTWIWMEDYGYKVVGRNGNSITLPAAGFRNRGDVYHVGTDGRYWSSTPYDSDYAWSLYFDSSAVYMYFYRGYGLSVRLVQ